MEFKHPENMLEVIEQSSGMCYRALGDHHSMPKKYVFWAVNTDLFMTDPAGDDCYRYDYDRYLMAGSLSDPRVREWLASIPVEFYERRKRNPNDDT